MLQKNNIALLNVFKSEICSKSKCMNPCREKCSKNIFTASEIENINKILKDEGIAIKIIKISLKKGIVSIPTFNSFNYTIRQEIKKAIAQAVTNMR